MKVKMNLLGIARRAAQGITRAGDAPRQRIGGEWPARSCRWPLARNGGTSTLLSRRTRAATTPRLDVELGPVVYDVKKPGFVIDGNFDVERFSKRPGFAIAPSPLSHPAAGEIHGCPGQQRKVAAPGTTFFATFFVGGASRNAATSHPHGMFQFARGELHALARNSG